MMHDRMPLDQIWDYRDSLAGRCVQPLLTLDCPSPTLQQQHELMGMALPRSSLSLRSLLLLMSQRKPHRSSFFSSSAGPGPAAVLPAAPGTGTPVAPAVQPPAAPAEEPSAHTLEDPKHPVLGGSCSTPQPVTCEPSPKTHPDDKVCKDSDLPVPGGARNSSRDEPPRSSGGTSDIGARNPVEP
ncbi:early nodulin-like protein 2 isoform X2 [Hordeum vulgare subsp. vulgare]|uniref:early nodulin-like protein 2 isoform X2 n=1 Tax=Hordeum vulgare subsp. vulgare TaxID=112509 RepID=UPI001D1A5677|nr:early nodulin-like protein 2 isoform X2 [Hordeum vulgare subsp. vulgare]